MKGNKSNELSLYSKPVSLEKTEIIVEQMKKSICKIYINNDNKGIGFFCKIPFPNNKYLLSVLITTNDIINESLLEKEKQIKISINNDNKKKVIEFNNRIIYTNKKYDITIIEIKEKRDNILNFLELEDIENINNEKINMSYIEESVYILHYYNSKDICVSYGILNQIKEKINYNFNHLCYTDKYSSGGPILNLASNKVIGLQTHIEGGTNKNIGLFLNYAIRDFLNQEYYNKLELREFNKRFKIDLNDNNIEILDLSKKHLMNNDLEYIIKIDPIQLKELNLSMNDISDIKILEKFRFKKLEKLNLSWNKITDIKILEKVCFNELKELDLRENKLKDVDALEKMNFIKLEKLDLSRNNISNIDILAKAKFKNLIELNLNTNTIPDIGFLENAKFEKIKILDLGVNKILNINILEKCDFKELKELYLYNINISDILFLENIKFEKLEKLDLSLNIISDIKILEKVKFKELKE